MNLEYNEAVGEVLQILKYTEDNLVRKIPKKLIEFWTEISKNNSEFKIDPNKPIKEIEIKEKSKDLIGMIYRNYWCSPEERKEYDKILRENEEKFQEEARRKYNPDNIFKPIEETKKIEEIESRNSEANNANIVPYKENIFTKIIQKIKNILKK